MIKVQQITLTSFSASAIITTQLQSLQTDSQKRALSLKECNQCGKCCTKYGGDGLSVSDEEIELWETFRPDLYEYVKNGEIWMDPATGKQLERCPWLRKTPNQEIYTCDIYMDRPDDCKFYPVTISQMAEDKCEMLEVQDLTNPKRAQNKLNKIMVNSRPPYKL